MGQEGAKGFQAEGTAYARGLRQERVTYLRAISGARLRKRGMKVSVREAGLGDPLKQREVFRTFL